MGKSFDGRRDARPTIKPLKVAFPRDNGITPVRWLQNFLRPYKHYSPQKLVRDPKLLTDLEVAVFSEAMSRIKHIFNGVYSIYLLLVAIAIYSLASIPLALSYLDTNQFGLWGVMGALSSYIALIDIGMMNAGCRLFIDHKDNKDGGEYGSLIKSCILVSAAQGCLIVLIGLFSCPFLVDFLTIPSNLSRDFVQLFSIQCGVIALNCMTRIFMLLLFAHQRVDLVNYWGIVSLLLNFFSQWLFFYLGFGVLSLAFGGLVATLCVIPMQFRNCLTVNVFPSAGHWGKPSYIHFKELFTLGRDLFLVSLGTHLVIASQSIIITRYIGLDAAAVWSIGLRMFYLLNQAISRLTDITEPVFAEMITRSETSRLKERYSNLSIVGFSLAGWFALSFASCNSLFVSVWTHGKIQWSVQYDLLLAIWMILLSITNRHSKFITITKEIGFLRYIYFLEGSAFIISSSLLIRNWGLSGMLICSIVCGILFSGLFCIWRVSKYFGFTLNEVGLQWLGHAVIMLLCLIPVLVGVWHACAPLPDLTRLTINFLVSGSVGAILFLRFGIPHAVRAIILKQLPSWGGSFLQRVLRAL